MRTSLITLTAAVLFLLGTPFAFAQSTVNSTDGIPNNVTPFFSDPSSNAAPSAAAPAATTGTCDSNTSFCNPLKTDKLSVFLANILSIVTQIGAIIVILMLVWTGFKFVTARGNPEELSSAKKMLLWTIIGALILLGAQAIALGVQTTVNAL